MARASLALRALAPPPRGGHSTPSTAGPRTFPSMHPSNVQQQANLALDYRRTAKGTRSSTPTSSAPARSSASSRATATATRRPRTVSLRALARTPRRGRCSARRSCTFAAARTSRSRCATQCAARSGRCCSAAHTRARARTTRARSCVARVWRAYSTSKPSTTGRGMAMGTARSSRASCRPCCCGAAAACRLSSSMYAYC
jgi:hypothetical protein